MGEGGFHVKLFFSDEIFGFLKIIVYTIIHKYIFLYNLFLDIFFFFRPYFYKYLGKVGCRVHV